MGRKKKLKKEEIAEDWCFVCKDGGPLRICDRKDCLKVYHPRCVGKDESLLVNEDQWACNWHFCSVCRKASNFRCLCCPSAVCKNCLYDAQFAMLKTDKGFCNSCLQLVSLIEMKNETNTNEGKIDFNDPNTTESFFNGYWEVTKKKEGLTSEQVISAYNLLQHSEGYKSTCDSYNIDEEEEYTPPLHWSGKRKISKGETTAKQGNYLTAKEPVSFQNRVDQANQKEWSREYPLLSLLPLQMPSDDPHSLCKVPVVLAETQVAQQDHYDGLPLQDSCSKITSKGNKSSCHMNHLTKAATAPSSQPTTAVVESELPKTKEGVPSPCPAIVVSESELPKAKEAAPSSKTAMDVSESDQATTIEIIDVKEETEEINPLDEGKAFFAELQSVFDESLKDLPVSSKPPLVTAKEIIEAKQCFHQCCSLNFEHLIHCGLKDNFISSLNLLLTSGYFPENLLSVVISFQLTFLSNTSLYSQCLEEVRKADEEKEQTVFLTKEVTDKLSCLDQIAENIKVADGEIQELRKQLAELKKQLAEKRKFRASLNAQAKGVVDSCRTSREVLLQSIQSSKMSEKRKESNLKLMRGIDESWNKFQLEILKLL